LFHHRIRRLRRRRRGTEIDGSPVGFDERGPEPVGDLAGVGDGCRQRDKLDTGGEPAEMCERDFQGRAAIGLAQQVYLVDDDTADIVDPARAVADRRIDLFAGGDDDIVVGQLGGRRVVIPRCNPDIDTRQLAEGCVFFGR